MSKNSRITESKEPISKCLDPRSERTLESDLPRSTLEGAFLYPMSWLIDLCQLHIKFR